jgi:hypothetical protein
MLGRLGARQLQVGDYAERALAGTTGSTAAAAFRKILNSSSKARIRDCTQRLVRRSERRRPVEAPIDQVAAFPPIQTRLRDPEQFGP